MKLDDITEQELRLLQAMQSYVSKLEKYETVSLDELALVVRDYILSHNVEYVYLEKESCVLNKPTFPKSITGDAYHEREQHEQYYMELAEVC